MAQTASQATQKDSETSSTVLYGDITRVLTKHEMLASEKNSRLQNETNPDAKRKLTEEIKFENYAQQYVDHLYNEVVIPSLARHGVPIRLPTMTAILKQAETLATARLKKDNGALSEKDFNRM